MRRQDVQPGKVYAYREGQYGGYKKAVILTPVTKDTLYTTKRTWGDAPAQGFIRDRYRTSPSAYNGYTPATGWLMAISRSGKDVTSASLQEALEEGRQIAEDGIPVAWEESDYEYKLITSMSYLHGDYDQLLKAEVDAEALRAERNRARMEENKAVAAAFLPIRDSLRRQFPGNINLMSGGSLWEPNYTRPGISAPTHLTLDREAAEDLMLFLSAQEELIHSLREEFARVANENDDLRGQIP